MNIRDNSNINSPAEPRNTAKVKNSALRHQGGFFSTSLFVVSHQYQTQIENLAGIDVSEAVTRLIKRIDPYLSGVDAANKNNPGLDARIANEFRELADHLHCAMKALVQECIARFDRTLLQLDLAINSVDRKINDYRVRAPELLQTVFAKAEFDLKQADSGVALEKIRFEQFRYRHKLKHREPRKVTRFSITLTSALAVLLVGYETVIGSEMLKALFVGNASEGFIFVLAFIVANIVLGAVFVGWFGVRYLVHVNSARKLFPGVFCISLGMLGIFAIALYLCLLVAEVERLSLTTSELRVSASAPTAQHEADRQQAFNNAKVHFLNVQADKASSKHSLTIFLVILFSATLAYAGALQASDIYPGFSAAAQALKNAQSERRSSADKGTKMITKVERSIIGDLKQSLYASESLVVDVESAVVSMKVLVSDADHVTGAQREGYRECVSLYCRSTTEPYADDFEGSFGFKVKSQRAEADKITSTIIAMRVDSEEILRKLNDLAIEKCTAADTQLRRQRLANEELDKLVIEIRQGATEYKSKLNQEQSEY